MAKCKKKYCENEAAPTLEGYCQECWADQHIDDGPTEEEIMKSWWED